MPNAAVTLTLGDTRVEAEDGYVGKVDEFVVNPENGQKTHFAMREGHLWGKKDVIISLSAMSETRQDTVILKLDKHQIEALPTFPVQRPCPDRWDWLGDLPGTNEKLKPGRIKYLANLPENFPSMDEGNPVMMIDRRSTSMNDNQPWTFTCKTCGGHKLTVTRVWKILAGPDSETWQEWGPLEADHHWIFKFKEKIEKEKDNDDEVERWDFAEYTKDDSSTKPEEYEIYEPEDNPGNDRFYVNCASCDREIEFGWSQPDRGGRVFPVECSDFIPGKYWPELRYLDSWQQKGWLKKELKNG